MSSVLHQIAGRISRPGRTPRPGCGWRRGRDVRHASRPSGGLALLPPLPCTAVFPDPCISILGSFPATGRRILMSRSLHSPTVRTPANPRRSLRRGGVCDHRCRMATCQRARRPCSFRVRPLPAFANFPCRPSREQLYGLVSGLNWRLSLRLRRWLNSWLAWLLNSKLVLFLIWMLTSKWTSKPLSMSFAPSEAAQRSRT